jgi:hypothetical protein
MQILGKEDQRDTHVTDAEDATLTGLAETPREYFQNTQRNLDRLKHQVPMV